MSGIVQVVVGGQFGSEAKGAVAAYLSEPEPHEQVEGARTPIYAVRVGGGNAGHTVIGRCPPDCDGGHHLEDDPDDTAWRSQHPWRLRQVPVAAVSNPDARLVIAAGSEIDPAVLESEIVGLEAAGYAVRDRLVVDLSATVVTAAHQRAESGGGLESLFSQGGGLVERIGSTGKGIGAARADRAMRGAKLWPEVGSDTGVADTGYLLRRALRETDARVVIEGTQGYGLGLHTRYYPQCTSGDCRAIDFLAQAGISPWDHGVAETQVFVVCRVYPIRVAGNSGPLHRETSWAALGLPDEYTTVTRKVRRVGLWDQSLVAEAVDANGGGPSVRLALMMLDQMFLDVKGETDWSGIPPEAQKWALDAALSLNTRLALVGTSPSTLVDLR